MSLLRLSIHFPQELSLLNVHRVRLVNGVKDIQEVNRNGVKFFVLLMYYKNSSK